MEQVLTGYFFDSTAFDKETQEKNADMPLTQGTGRKLRCRFCMQIITDESQQIIKLGRHEHIKTNPAGISFNFRCFQSAPGCSSLGGPTTEYSWFQGYSWSIAVCSGCGEHIGWRYRGDDSFFGLISTSLVPDSDLPG